jgi:hypothetical protein
VDERLSPGVAEHLDGQPSPSQFILCVGQDANSHAAPVRIPRPASRITGRVGLAATTSPDAKRRTSLPAGESPARKY